MTALVPWLSAFSTVLGLTVFCGIVWWAWSPKRRVLNEEASRLPFDLPDETASVREMK